MPQKLKLSRRTMCLSGVGLAVAGLTAVILSGCGRSQGDERGTSDSPANAAALTRIDPVAVQLQDLSQTVEMAGTVEGFETAELYAKVGGYISVMHVDIGDSVSQGQPLAELDIPEIQNELEQKQALIRQAEAELEQAAQAILQADAARESARAAVLQAQAEKLKDQADLSYRQAEYDRQAGLWEQRSTRKEIFDAAAFQLQAAQAEMGVADARITTAEKMFSAAEADYARAHADHAAAQARLDVAQANAAYVETMMQYRVIRAPFDGHVITRWMDPGAFIQPAEGNSAAKPIFTVARTDVVRVILDVPMNDVRLLDVGDRAVLSRINVLPGDVIEGVVARCSGGLNVGSRMMRLEIDLPNDDHRLKPGYYGYVTVYLEELAQTPVVPSSALLTDDEGVYVYVVHNDTIHKTRVQPVFQDGEIVGVEAGALQAGDVVVRAGGGQLTDGQAVLVGAAT